VPISYRLRPGFVVAAPIATVGARIQGLKQARGGEVTPEDIVADAASPGSPLHPCFTWDDSEAARKCRLAEASYLIRAYEVVIERPNLEPVIVLPGSVHVTTPDKRDVYIDPVAAMNNADYRRQVLAQTLAQIRGLQHRLTCLERISPEITAAFDQLLALFEAEVEAAKPRRKRRPAAG
jgi:hypothetical protein